MGGGTGFEELRTFVKKMKSKHFDGDPALWKQIEKTIVLTRNKAFTLLIYEYI